jgi:hypothetical protein
MQDVIRSLSDLRDRYPGLESGPQKFRYAKNATLVFSRYDKKSDTELLFLFNSGRSASKVPLSAISRAEDGREFAIERGQAEILKSHITLPAISWSLLTRKPRDVAGEPKIKLLTPTRYKYDPTLLFLRASVTGSDFGEVEFQYLKGKGEWQSLGKDNSPTFDPTGKRVGDIYRVAPSVAALGQGNSLRFRAILRDNSDSKVLSRQVLLRLGK